MGRAKAVRSLCVISAIVAFGAGCGAPAPSAPSRSSIPVTPAAAQGLATAPILGSSSPDLARCLSGAGDPACFSGARPIVRATAAAASAPGTPSGLTATANGSSVTLTWSAPTSGDTVVTYVIEAGSAPGLSNLAVVTTNSTSTTFSSGGVGNGTYYVRIKAQNGSGTSAASNEVALTVTGSLTGTWVGLSPDGLVMDPSTGNCDVEYDVQLTLTQTGGTLSGTLYVRLRKAARAACQGQLGTVSGPWTATGTAGTGTLTLSVTAGTTVAFQGTFTNIRMSLSAPGFATVTLNRQ